MLFTPAAHGVLAGVSQLYYFEIQLVSDGNFGTLTVGIATNPSATIYGLTGYSTGYQYAINGTSVGLVNSASPVLSNQNSDLFGFAWDTSGNLYCRVNGTFYDAAGHNTGTTPTSPTVIRIPGGLYRPMVSYQFVGTGGGG
jgi:hypothetical protein